MGEPAMRLIPGLFGASLFVTACLAIAPARAQAEQGSPGLDDQAGGQSRRGAGWEQTGQASWYGGRHAGHLTANGTIFNPAEMTAAHPTLPLGSRIRVTMQDTGASVIVTVTDRQPPHGRRIIDLSHGAAERIGLTRHGVGLVTLAEVGREVGSDDSAPVEVAEAPDPADAGLDDTPAPAAFTASRHGRRHTRRVARAASAGRPYYRVQSVALVRSSAPHRAARHRL